MRKILIIIVLLCNIEITYSQDLDTIPLRSIYINDFCLGDSVNRLFEVFGIPHKKEMGVVDKAIENTQPSKNIYYYGKFAYFSEPYEISKGKIGEFCNLMNDSVNMELRIILNNDTAVFKVGDSLNIKKIEYYFPKSFHYMKEKELERSSRAAYLYLIPSEQDNYFSFPYPFITDITLMYLDNILISFKSNYFSE